MKEPGQGIAQLPSIHSTTLIELDTIVSMAAMSGASVLDDRALR